MAGGPLHANEQVLLVCGGSSRAGALAQSLQDASIVPSLAFTPGQALTAAGLYDFRLVVLDLPLGPVDLHALVTNLRGRTRAPLIVIAADADVSAGAQADCTLDPGATFAEIVARARALLTISGSPNLATTLLWGPLELDLRRRLARWYLKPLRLTSIQFRMMEVLVLAAGSMVTARELSRRVWGSAIVEDEDRIRAHVWRIRKLIEARPSVPEFLLTVRGEGFRLADYEIAEPDIDLDGLDGAPVRSDPERAGVRV